MSQEFDRIWDIGVAPPQGEAGPIDDARYEVTEITGLVPLDAQMGIDPPQTLPDAMQPLFAGDDLQTYALLDAAKIDNLPERLENADLPHACLFDDTDTLGGAAPWLIEIAPDAPLTRFLFTDGQGPKALWRADAGVFLRASDPLAELRGYLRRFVQVRSTADEVPVFFRFWDPRVMARYLQAHSLEASANLVALLNGGEMIAVDRHNDRAVQASAKPPQGRPPRLWPKLRADLAPIRYAIFCEDLADRIAKDIPPLAEVARGERREVVHGLVTAARGIGLNLDKSVTRYVYAALALGGQPEQDARFGAIVASDRHELDRSRLILKLAQTLE